jgi:hypothetical protein
LNDYGFYGLNSYGAVPQKLGAAPFLLKGCGDCSTNKINPPIPPIQIES